MEFNELHEREIAILNYVTDCVNDGVPPTVREICKNLAIKSTSTAHKYLKSLEAKGFIEMGDNLNRCIRLNKSRSVNVPLLGTVTAGNPILALQTIEDYVPFMLPYGDAKDLFALHVKGESMINAAILDGDIVIVKRTAIANNGDIVVALIGDEATVKTFYKEDNHFRLQPENDTMAPIIVNDVAILGKVISLTRFM